MHMWRLSPRRMAVLNFPSPIFVDNSVVSNNFYLLCVFVTDKLGEDGADKWCHPTVGATTYFRDETTRGQRTVLTWKL